MCYVSIGTSKGRKNSSHAHKTGTCYLLGVLLKNFDEQPSPFYERHPREPLDTGKKLASLGSTFPFGPFATDCFGTLQIYFIWHNVIFHEWGRVFHQGFQTQEISDEGTRPKGKYCFCHFRFSCEEILHHASGWSIDLPSSKFDWKFGSKSDESPKPKGKYCFCRFRFSCEETLHHASGWSTGFPSSKYDSACVVYGTFCV